MKRRKIALLFFSLLFSVKAMALTCDVLPEHQNLSCQGTFVAKTPEALSQYASTLKIKNGLAKNLTIDFDVDQESLSIATPCRITLKNNRKIHLKGDLCLRADSDLTFLPGSDISVQEMSLTSINKIAIRENATIVAKDISLKSLGDTIRSRAHIRSNSNVQADSLSLSSFYRSTLGTNSVFNIQNQVELEVKGSDWDHQAALWPFTNITANSLSIKSNARTYISKGVVLNVPNAFVSGALCHINKKVNMSAISLSGNCFDMNRPLPILKTSISTIPGSTTVQFDGSSSTSSIGKIQNYLFVFGDGTETRSSTPLVEHTYKNDTDKDIFFDARMSLVLEDGTISYPVKRRIKVLARAESSNNLPVISSIYSGRIQAGPPVKMFFGVDEASDADGEIVSYLWNFGDGKEIEVTTARDSEGYITHEFVHEGMYEIKVTAIDNLGGRTTFSKMVEVINSKAPIAKIKVDSLFGNTPLTVGFDGSDSFDIDGTISRYRWTIYDGGSKVKKDGDKVSYTFNNPGIHKVKLVVYDNTQGMDTAFFYIYAGVEAPVNGLAPRSVFKNSSRLGSVDTVFQTDASYSYDIDGEIVDYFWDFGEYGSATRLQKGMTASHKYKTPGTYNIVLTVVDNMGNSSTSSSTLFVQNPNSATILPDFFIFKNNDQEYSFTADPNFFNYNYNPEVLFWDMGDGEINSGRNIVHQFSENGTFEVGLVLDEIHRGIFEVNKEFVLTDNMPVPTANIGESYIVAKNTEATFDASESISGNSGELSYFWSFGDGTVYRGKGDAYRVSKHRYQTSGFHDALLIVTNDQLISDARFFQVNVTSGAIPSASFYPDMYQGMAPLKVHFDASGSVDQDGEITSYQWQLSSGESDDRPIGIGESFDYTFEAPGRYFVRLTVTDNEGNIAEREEMIEVTEPGNMPSASFTCLENKGLINCESSSYDPDGYLISQVWMVNGNEYAHGPSVEYQSDIAGLIPISLLVTDNVGNTAQMTTEVYASEKYSLLYASIGFSTRDNITFQMIANTTGGTGTIVSYEWLIDENVVLTGQETSYAFSTSGNHSIGLKVVDSDGNIAFATNYLYSKVAPIASLSCLVNGRSITCDTSGTSDDQAIMSYQIEYGDGETLRGNIPPKEFFKTYNTTGEFQISLTVIDNDGLQSVATQNIVIENISPGSDFSCSSHNTTLMCESNPENNTDGDELSYEWIVDGNLLGNTRTLNTALESIGSKHVKLVVTDSFGAKSTSEKSVLMTASELPVVEIVADNLWGEPSFTFEASSKLVASPNGEIVRYAWLLNGEEIIGEDLSYILNSSGTYTVELVVTDRIGATASDKVHVVVNSRPIVEGELTIVQGASGHIIQGDSSGTYDPDGGVTSFEWDLADGSSKKGNRFEYPTFVSGVYPVRLTVRDDNGLSASKIVSVEIPESDISIFNHPPATGVVGRTYEYAPAIKVASDLDTKPEISINLLSSFDWCTIENGIITLKPTSAGNYKIEMEVISGELSRVVSWQFFVSDRLHLFTSEKMVVGDSFIYRAPGTDYDQLIVTKDSGDEAGQVTIFLDGASDELFIEKANREDSISIEIPLPSGGIGLLSKSRSDTFDESIPIEGGAPGYPSWIPNYNLHPSGACSVAEWKTCARVKADVSILNIDKDPHLSKKTYDSHGVVVYFYEHVPTIAQISNLNFALKSAMVRDIPIFIHDIGHTRPGMIVRGRYQLGSKVIQLDTATTDKPEILDLVLAHEYSHYLYDKRCDLSPLVGRSDPVFWIFESIAAQAAADVDVEDFYKYSFIYKHIGKNTSHIGQYIVSRSLNIFKDSDIKTLHEYGGLFYPGIYGMMEGWCDMSLQERAELESRTYKNGVNTSLIELAGYKDNFEGFALHFLNYVEDANKLFFADGLKKYFAPTKNIDQIDSIGTHKIKLDIMSGKSVAISNKLLSSGVVLRIENIPDGVVFNGGSCGTFSSESSCGNHSLNENSEFSKYSFRALGSRVRWVYQNSTTKEGNTYINFAYLWDHSLAPNPPQSVTLEIKVLDVPFPTFELPFLKPYWQMTHRDPTGFTVYSETGDWFKSSAECPTSELARLYNIKIKTETTIPVEDNPWGFRAVCLDSAFANLSDCGVLKDVQYLMVCNAVSDCVYAPIGQLLESNDILYNKCFAEWL